MLVAAIRVDWRRRVPVVISKYSHSGMKDMVLVEILAFMERTLAC